MGGIFFALHQQVKPKRLVFYPKTATMFAKTGNNAELCFRKQHTSLLQQDDCLSKTHLRIS
ncbi:hypothetical protein GCM10023185_39570 [Hymenobacter saemangeumensis]|uniref:Uncharacterized protein n=1 Tax=Hymenobacter saemangeumensis TaxID=1084522 RepID=A0ABP8IRA7_9BACT